MNLINFDRSDPLFRKALTHKSYEYQNKNTISGNNERLEFLGDSVLDLIISEKLVQDHPEAQEGTLTLWRASLVNTKILSEISSSLKLHEKILIGRGEEKLNCHKSERILACTLEAVIGAFYLKYGFETTKKRIIELFEPYIKNLSYTERFEKDYKTKVQEIFQENKCSPPEYKVVKEEGPAHKRIFTVQLVYKEKSCYEAQGKSKKEASQNAAQKLLQEMTSPEEFFA